MCVCVCVCVLYYDETIFYYTFFLIAVSQQTKCVGCGLFVCQYIGTVQHHRVQTATYDDKCLQRPPLHRFIVDNQISELLRHL